MFEGRGVAYFRQWYDRHSLGCSLSPLNLFLRLALKVKTVAIWIVSTTTTPTSHAPFCCHYPRTWLLIQHINGWSLLSTPNHTP